MFIVALVIALLSLAASLWLRQDTPSSRAWETQDGLVDERFAFVFLPSFTLLLFGLGMVGMSGMFETFSLPVKLLFAVGLVATGVGGLGSLVGLFSNRYPLWLLPKWRMESPHRK
ncbi:MAG: hypothetical protein Q4E01_05105 [Actinomycetaceae bacterium]|nr:hypothetical protein [Actinomycetaceae bacterium]